MTDDALLTATAWRACLARSSASRRPRCGAAPSCGAQRPVGAHRAYLGVGVVLRCPACGDVALRIGVTDDVLVFEVRGTLTAQRPR